jgi:hypothetical protein
MADIIKLTTKFATSTTGTFSAGAASFTIPLGAGGDSQATLCVYNGAAETCRVVVAAGDGERADLGALTVDVDTTTHFAFIPLTDSARFKTFTTDSVTVALNDTADTSLTATPLALIKCGLIQG